MSKSKSATVPATVQAVTVAAPVADLPSIVTVKDIRKSRIESLARASHNVVDAIDTVSAVSRSIRCGVDEACTVGRMDAAHAIAAACDALTVAKAPVGKVAAFKWGLLARVASAKRK